MTRPGRTGHLDPSQPTTINERPPTEPSAHPRGPNPKFVLHPCRSSQGSRGLPNSLLTCSMSSGTARSGPGLGGRPSLS